MGRRPPRKETHPRGVLVNVRQSEGQDRQRKESHAPLHHQGSGPKRPKQSPHPRPLQKQRSQHPRITLKRRRTHDRTLPAHHHIIPPTTENKKYQLETSPRGCPRSLCSGYFGRHANGDPQRVGLCWHFGRKNTIENIINLIENPGKTSYSRALRPRDSPSLRPGRPRPLIFSYLPESVFLH